MGGIGSGFIVAMLSGLASWFRHQLAEPPASRREAADEREGQKKKRGKGRKTSGRQRLARLQVAIEVS